MMMKTRKAFVLVALLAFGSQAAVRDEWTFQTDAKGTLLRNAVNSGPDGSVFESGGIGTLETDGLGRLLSTPSAPTLWGDGATLDADIADANTLFLRYDLSYNFTSGAGTNGTSVGISFVDNTGTNLAGLVFAYEPDGWSGGAPDGQTLAPVGDPLPLQGTLSAIAEVSLSSISIWYSTNGTDFVAGMTNAAIAIASIADLRIQATGEASPPGSGDFVAVENIRVADSWASITGIVQPSVPSKYLNEWLFDRDAAGRTLSEAINSGTDRAVFSTDTTPVTQTDGFRGLICANDVPNSGNLWTNGAVLTAPVKNQTSGSRFLRYDFDYDMTATNNNTGTLLSLGFGDGASTNLAAVTFKYDIGSPNASPPAGITETALRTDLELTGSLSVIAEVDLDRQKMSVWYNLTGDNTFNQWSPDGTHNINLTTVDQLTFRATGDFIASASNECVVIDNIRTAATWAEIIEPPVNLRGPPELTIRVNDDLGGVMAVGQTNLISVTIHNNGGPATNVSSTLVSDNAGALSIISSNNAATAIPAGGVLVQTYSVVANPSADGSYVLTAQATIAGTSSGAPAMFDLYVGAQISYASYVITNETGVVNTFPNEAEPGEIFDLVITSVNDGGVPVSGITNSLAAVNSSYFPTIVATNSNTYASMNVGGTTSTTYRVTCSTNTPNGLQTFTVINATAGKAWTNQFQLNVRSGAALSLATNALTLRVAPGATASASVTLSNIGNSNGLFTVTADARRPFTYDVDVQSKRRQSFDLMGVPLPGTLFTNWSGTTSAPMDIGFAFPLFGTKYTTFTVSQNGFITLGSSGSETVQVTPFQTATAAGQSTIRYKKTTDRLIVAWGNDGIEKNGTEFQVWLNTDGTVEYLYELGTWGSGTIALGNQAITHTPGQTGQDSLLLSPGDTWVTIPPSGSVGVGGTQSLTFSADAPAGQAAGAYPFTTTVNWGSDSADIAVTVVVEADRVQLLAPATFTFSGPAGSISPPATLTVTNSGNVPLSYVITDTGVRNASYGFNGTAGYQWTDIPAAANYILDASELGTRSVPIGFPFVFFGTTYTNLTVGKDGTLTLGTSANRIIPFSAGLTLDGNSSVRFFTDLSLTRFVATWENLAQPGGGADQTFQAILTRDGRIRFNYQRLSGNWPTGIIRLNGSSTLSGTLSNSTTTVTTTNVVTTTGYVTNWIGNFSFVSETNVVVGTNVVTTYTDTANRQAVEFTPGKQQIITCSPVSGTIQEGKTANITLRGDARSLAAGGTNTVSTSTTLAFGYARTSRSVAVTFNATNSTVKAYPLSAEIVEATWGADPMVSIQQNSDGSRTLSWPAANDPYNRIYTVLYTTSLSDPWKPLAIVTNLTSHTDLDHFSEPVIFYKVTVE